MKTMRMIFLSMFIFHVASVRAETIRWVGQTGNWSDTTQWDLGRVPASADSVRISENGEYAVVESGDDVVATQLLLGRYSGSNYATLEVSGVLEILNDGWMGGYDGTASQENNVGILKISGGAFMMHGALWAGLQGGAQINMTSGTATFTGGLEFGRFNVQPCSMDLAGGVLTVNLLTTAVDKATHPLSINIHGGMLKIGGNRIEELQGWEADGYLYSSYGARTVVIEYDGTHTVVTADVNGAFRAYDPIPAENAFVVPPSALSWTAGDGALSHTVYLGTDPASMTQVATGITSTTHTLAAPLELGQTYYWQVEEVGPSGAFLGPIWKFTASVAVLPTIYHLNLGHVFDLTADESYDIQHVAVGLQSLVNREVPRTFVAFEPDDGIWLSRLREPGGLCEGWGLQTIDVQEYLDLFMEYASGVVLYDPDPYADPMSTMLVASMVAGVEGGLAVRKDTSAGSMYNYLVNDAAGPQLPVLVDLAGKFTGSGTIWDTAIPSSGSAKCDAYLWAIEKYVDTGKCNTTELSYSSDLWGLRIGASLHAQLRVLDYAMSKNAFCFELSPWGDEIPNDDPGQPLGADLETFIKILDHCNAQNGYDDLIHVCGFPNWATKYTSGQGGSHGAVATEWEFMRLLSAYNGYTDVEFGSSSTSFYSALGPEVKQRRYTQNAPPSYADMVADGLIDASGNVVPGNYSCIVMGDYDSPAWTLYRLNGGSGVFSQPSRGQVNCNWGVNPNLVDKVSVAMDYMYRNKTDKDYFAAWDSGCGYANPGQFYGTRQSGYPSIVPTWQDHCRQYFRQMDYSITAWILNGDQKLTAYDADYYSDFSGDGIGFYTPSNPSFALVNNSPVKLISGSSSTTQWSMQDFSTGVNFAWYRAVNWNIGTQSVPSYVPWGPDHVKALEDQYASSGHNHRFLDIYTYYYLMRHYLGGNNNYRATWISDTLPRIMAAGQVYPVTVTVRNDGWDTWTETDLYGLGHSILPEGSNTATSADYAVNGRTSLPGGTAVAPGQSVEFSLNVTAPTTNGNYDLYYDMTSADQPDYFTEVFDGADNDLDYHSITFSPDGSSDFYGAQVDQITSFGSDTSGATVLSLWDNGSATINLNGVQVELYGQKYSTFYVNNNGNITFAGSDGTNIESLSAHFNQPRISALFRNLRDRGTVSWQQLADRAVVTWENVIDWSIFSENSFQVELFYDGRTRISWLGIAVVDGLWGLSEGMGLPSDYQESNLDFYGVGGGDGVNWFHERNNIEWKKEIVVATHETDIDADGDGMPDVTEEQYGLLYWNPDDRIEQAQATVVLGDLAQTYDGSAKAISSTTVPSGLVVELAYDGLTNAPADPGSYTVVGTISDIAYQGSATNTLIIEMSAAYNAWKAEWFSVAEQANPAISGPDVDYDSDGFSNWEEYISGTDPADGLCSSAWQTIIPVSEDTYVMTTPVGGYAGSNYGDGDLRTGVDIRGNADPADDRFQQSYTKYDLSGLSGTITNATVYTRTQFGNANINLGIYEIGDDSWTEMGMTWNNRPTTGSLLKTHGPVNNGEWVAVDVTDLVIAAVAGGTDHFLSLMFNDLAGMSSITQSGMNFFSKESAASISRPDLISYLDVTTASPKVLFPIDDSWVLLNTNDPAQYGNTTPGGGELRVGSDASQMRHSRSFLKFNLCEITDTVTNAQLYIRASSANTDLNLGVYEVATDTWTEGTLTWDNQPVFGALAVTHGNITNAGWIAIDVTASVLETINNGPNHLWSILLKEIDGAMSPSTQVSFRSKEIPGDEPMLVINQVQATVMLGDLVQTYDGSAKTVSSTTIPPGLAVELTYDGLTNAPTDMGSYTVVGTINDIAYQGSAINTLEIEMSAAYNAWNAEWFTAEEQASPAISGPEVDYDSDGFSNWEEYIAGTDPTDGLAFPYFQMQPEVAVPNGYNYILHWSSVSGRVYSANWSPDLLQPFIPLQTNILWPQSSYTDETHQTESKGFYRMEISHEL